MTLALPDSIRSLLPQLRLAPRQGDLLLAGGVLAILVVLILPLPAFVLDLCLALSVTLSVLILLTALFIEKPLEFSAFPTVLLIATMLRLSLNLASTRLILGHGHEGPAAAGHVIELFGRFIMQGNVVIGVIVFGILVVVNFVVITKGSGRIAEVAARFSLDAMPGKQMAIDADLSAGLIDEATARERRRTLEAESGFFGAMDGAAKFVRGDAVAGLLITAINLVGGLFIGVAQMGVSFGEAVHTYTLLTVGDGLVSQIPGLVVSMAAGLLVSKAGVAGRADVAVFGQLGAYPRALGVTGGLMVLLAILPGLPALPFLLLGAAAGGLAWQGARTQRRRAESAEARDQPAGPRDEPITSALAIDPVRLELGYGLLGLIGDGRGPRLPDQIKALRRQLAAELGFVMPSVRIQDNIQLPANTYVLRLKELEVARGEIRAEPAARDGPAGPADQPARRGHDRADLRPAGDVGGARPARRGRDPGPDGGRPGDRGHDPPDRGRAREPGRPAQLRRDPEAAGRAAARSTRSCWASWCRAASPRPASSACCRGCSPSGSRSATCR